MKKVKDIEVLRELSEKYMDIARLDIQQQRRKSWAKLNSLKMQKPLVLTTYGMWNVWCKDFFADSKMKCNDPFYRYFEKNLRMNLFQHKIEDDYILEPWISLEATNIGSFRNLWGLDEGHHASNIEGGSWKYDPPIKDWKDIEKLSPKPHKIDEKDTQERYERIQNAIGDIITINIERGPVYRGFSSDISTSVAGLRGLEQIMLDMYESPKELHKLLCFMKDKILIEQKRAEEKGDWTLTTQSNQSMTYAMELEAPKANSKSCKREALWEHCAAQEFTLISPEMHNEFLLQYQLPIMKNFGLIAYGCCENLTNKIDILRQIPNLRQIAVAPVADVGKCAEQIGTDYVISWRPNPTDMICGNFDENKIRRIIGDGLDKLKGTNFHICLKDVETVESEPERLHKWTLIVKDEIEKHF